MNLSKTIYLNPDYHFKNDIDRIVMYSHREVSQYSSPEWISFIHPIQAAILSMFTEKRFLKENIELLSKHFNISESKVQELINPYINNQESFYTEFNSHKVYFPKHVLIESSRLPENKPLYSSDKENLKCKEVDLTPDRIHKAPQSMLFMLTNKCITKCKYCYADKKTKCEELGTDQILRIIDESKKLKMSYIDIIGGEIFLKKDWDIILKHLVDSNLMPSFISTKIPITRKIAQALYETGYNNVVQISLDSLDNSKLKKIINSPSGYIEKMKEGIELLQEYGFDIFIDTILTKYNSTNEEILSMYEYIKTIKGLRHWEVRVPEKSIYTPTTFTEVKADKQILMKVCNFIKEEIIPNSEIKIIVSDNILYSRYQEGKCTDSFFDNGNCSVLQNKFFILPDGKVSICEQLYWHPQFIIGDLKEQSIEEVWQSEKAKSLLFLKKEYYREKSACKSCKTFDFCTDNHRRCWTRVIKAYGKDNWDYPDPKCCHSPAISSDMLY